jgi:Lon protease-like protein
VRRRESPEEFRISGVVDRLTPYETTEIDLQPDAGSADAELVERAATLLAVMPRNQLRQTIEHLLSPHDREQGRRAVDALIDAAFAIEDETGHIRRVT